MKGKIERREEDTLETTTKLLGLLTACVLIGLSSPVLGQEIQGFLYSNGNYTLLPYGTLAEGINNRGQIVGTYGLSGFIYQNGAFTNILNYPSAVNTDVTAISASGQVVGAYSVGDGALHGFTYSSGTYSPFSAISFPISISQSGQYIVGQQNGSSVGVLYHNGSLTTINMRHLSDSQEPERTSGEEGSRRGLGSLISGRIILENWEAR
jgi:probable HAF family extracellular repeat protein